MSDPENNVTYRVRKLESKRCGADDSQQQPETPPHALAAVDGFRTSASAPGAYLNSRIKTPTSVWLWMLCNVDAAGLNAALRV